IGRRARVGRRRAASSVGRDANPADPEIPKARWTSRSRPASNSRSRAPRSRTRSRSTTSSPSRGSCARSSTRRSPATGSGCRSSKARTRSRTTTSRPRPAPRAEAPAAPASEERELLGRGAWSPRRARRLRRARADAPRQRRRRARLGRAPLLRPRPVDAHAPRVLEDAPVEHLEAAAVVEVAQVRELVTQRVDEARVLERLSGARVEQPDADGAVLVADAEPAPHVRALRLDRAIAQAEGGRDAARVLLESLDQLVRGLRSPSPPARESLLARASRQ